MSLKMPMIEAIREAAAEERTGKMSARKPRKGFPTLRCPKCGEEGTVVVQVADLSLCCTSCDELKRADVDALIADWSRLLNWLDAAT